MESLGTAGASLDPVAVGESGYPLRDSVGEWLASILELVSPAFDGGRWRRA